MERTGKYEWETSVAELLGPIADLYGYVTRELGQTVFKINRIVFQDGLVVSLEGEHDCPYIPMDEELLEGLMDGED